MAGQPARVAGLQAREDHGCLASDWREGDLRQHFDTAAGFDRDDLDSTDGDDAPGQDSNEGSDDKGPRLLRALQDDL